MVKKIGLTRHREAQIYQDSEKTDFENANFRDNLFYIPFKKEWPIHAHDEVTWMSYTEALIEVNLRMIQKNAPMLWMRKASGIIDKLFVVWW